MGNVLHELKTWSEYFNPIAKGVKNFEVRKNDRNFKENDEILLKEYNTYTSEYTGRILHRKIEYILHGGRFGIEEGYCVLGLTKI